MTTCKEQIQMFSKELWERRDLTAIDRWVADDCVFRTPMTLHYGKMTLNNIIDKWFEAFPDLILFWRDFIAEDDKVVCRWRASGTHMGSFFETKPTNEEVNFSGVNTYRMQDNKIKEYWSLIDIHSILKQAGSYNSLAEVID